MNLVKRHWFRPLRYRTLLVATLRQQIDHPPSTVASAPTRQSVGVTSDGTQSPLCNAATRVGLFSTSSTLNFDTQLTAMATSAYPFFAAQSPRTQVIAHSSLRVAQVAALFTPPLVILSAIFRRNPLKPFTIKRLLNSTVRSTVVGAGIGGLVGWGRLNNQPETAILDRAERLVSLRILLDPSHWDSTGPEGEAGLRFAVPDRAKPVSGRYECTLTRSEIQRWTSPYR